MAPSRVGSADARDSCRVRGQVARASSVNEAAIRRAGGASMARSSWPRRRFCVKACPAMTTCAVLSVRSQRIGLNLCLSRL